MPVLKIADLTAHPKNEYYFDDIQGDGWNDLLQSVRTSGVTNAITVTKDGVIISGHQRVRACKLLGIEEIPAHVKEYTPEEQEKQKDVKDLIESNLKQRVPGNSNPVKLGRCFAFLEEYYNIGRGGDRKSKPNNSALKTQKELAEENGISADTMQNYKRLASSIPEMQELLNTGKVTPTTALAVMRQLSEEEQREFAQQVAGVEKLTGKQVEEYVSKIRELEQQAEERSKLLSELDRRVKDTEAENKTLKADNRTLANRVKPETVYLEPEDYQEVKNSLDKAEDTIEQRDAEIASLKQQLREASNEGNTDFSTTLYEYAVDDMATFISRYSDLAELSGVIGAMKELMA